MQPLVHLFRVCSQREAERVRRDMGTVHSRNLPLICMLQNYNAADPVRERESRVKERFEYYSYRVQGLSDNDPAGFDEISASGVFFDIHRVCLWEHPILPNLKNLHVTSHFIGYCIPVVLFFCKSLVKLSIRNTSIRGRGGEGYSQSNWCGVSKETRQVPELRFSKIETGRGCDCNKNHRYARGTIKSIMLSGM